MKRSRIFIGFEKPKTELLDNRFIFAGRLRDDMAWVLLGSQS